MPGRNQTLMRTRCPACSTVFRVTSEQLRAKAGKVRCGYCQVVFNAFDELIDETQPAAVMQPPAIEAAAQDEVVSIPEPESATDTVAVETLPDDETEIGLAGEDETVQDEYPDAASESADSEADELREIAPSGTLTAADGEPAVPVADETAEEATQAAREVGLVAARERRLVRREFQWIRD